MSHKSPQLYKIEPIPNTGLGIVATSSIPRGTLIITESPLFTTTLSPDPLTTGASTFNDVLAAALSKIDTLPLEQQDAYYSLHDFHAAENMTRAQSIFLSNVLSLDDVWFCGMFLTCSRINHSCAPNSFYSWNSTLQKLVVYATADISPGEQITISYLGDLLRIRDERQYILLQEFSFVCNCHACSLLGSAGINGTLASVTPPIPEENANSPGCDLPTVARMMRKLDLLVSDMRRRQIAILDAQSSGDLFYTNPAAALGCCRQALRLYQLEGLGGVGVYATYVTALRLCVAYGDLARASAFAVLAMEGLEVCCGGDAAGMKEVKPYVKHPEKHKLAGTSSVWRTRTKNMRQKGSSGFEEWLWSRAV